MTLQYEDFNKNLLVSCGSSLLDVGCGTGRWYGWKIKHSDRVSKYTGIDIDPEVVKKAILTYRTHADFTPDTFMVSNGADLSIFKDKSYETIILVEVIEHMIDLPTLFKLINECLRVAKKNIMITTPNCSDEELLRKNGLIYNHYTHSVGKGFEFKEDRSHKHYLRFTKDSLSDFFSSITSKFEVVERKPIAILKPVCYDKLFAEIIP